MDDFERISEENSSFWQIISIYSEPVRFPVKSEEF